MIKDYFHTVGLMFKSISNPEARVQLKKQLKNPMPSDIWYIPSSPIDRWTNTSTADPKPRYVPFDSYFLTHACSGRNITWQYLHVGANAGRTLGSGDGDGNENGNVSWILPEPYDSCPGLEWILDYQRCEGGSCEGSKTFSRYGGYDWGIMGGLSWDGLGDPAMATAMADEVVDAPTAIDAADGYVNKNGNAVYLDPDVDWTEDDDHNETIRSETSGPTAAVTDTSNIVVVVETEKPTSYLEGSHHPKENTGIKTSKESNNKPVKPAKEIIVNGKTVWVDVDDNDDEDLWERSNHHHEITSPRAEGVESTTATSHAKIKRGQLPNLSPPRQRNRQFGDQKPWRGKHDSTTGNDGSAIGSGGWDDLPPSFSLLPPHNNKDTYKEINQPLLSSTPKPKQSTLTPAQKTSLSAGIILIALLSILLLYKRISSCKSMRRSWRPRNLGHTERGTICLITGGSGSSGASHSRRVVGDGNVLGDGDAHDYVRFGEDARSVVLVDFGMEGERSGEMV